MKFSIRDLLLVTVIVALAAGWWVDHRAATRLVAANARLEQEAKTLRDQLGLLTVVDENKLHTIAIASDVAHAEKRWRWRLHFPSNRQFRICCAFSGLPESGVPAGNQVLYDTEGGIHYERLGRERPKRSVEASLGLRQWAKHHNADSRNILVGRRFVGDKLASGETRNRIGRPRKAARTPSPSSV